jgi:hypothetical protein
MPALVTYQILDNACASEPTTDRGAIEHVARACLHFGPANSLDAVVIETRYNVVRSNVPHTVASVRRLRDFLPGGEAGRLSTPGAMSRPPRSTMLDAELVGPW